MHAAHAGPIAHRLEVVALHVAAVDGTRLHGRPLHAGHAHVDRVLRLARHLHRDVEVLLLGAHQRPLLGRLQRDRLRGSGAACAPRARATLPYVVVRPLCACVMTLSFADELVRVDAPLVRGREHEPLARLGARELQVVAPVLDGRCRVRAHAPIEAIGNAEAALARAVAERRLAAAVRVRRAVARHLERPGRRHLARVAIRGRVDRPHLAPVALQLFADHHRVRRPHALAELRLRDADDDGVVGLDDDPRVDLGHRGLGVPSGAGRRGAFALAQCAAAARSRARTRRRLPTLRADSPSGTSCVAHAFMRSAAKWIALRTR